MSKTETENSCVEAFASDITFFVPCLNEEKNVVGALDNIIGAAGGFGICYEILVVDDCSEDATVHVVRKYMESHPHVSIQLLTRDLNRGLGCNYLEGARVSRGQYYMLVNGDNVERREVIEALLSKLGAADIIIPFFGSLDGRPLGRKVVSRIFTILVNTVSGTCIRYYNGAVIHLRENVLKYHTGTRGFGYQAELIIRLISEGATYVEVEVPSEERQHGVSSAFKVRNFVSIAGTIGRIARGHWFGYTRVTNTR